MLRWTVFFVCLCLSSVSFGQTTRPGGATGIKWLEWNEARKLYEEGKVNEALEELRTHPREEAGYYYNVGTLYFQSGKLGHAFAYLEKANRLYPHDPDIQHNLGTVRDALSQKIGPERIDPSSTWLEQMADRTSRDEARATLGLIALIVLSFWTRTYLRSRNLKETLFQPSGSLGLLAFLITLGVYGLQRWSEANPIAICLAQQQIRSGPGDQFLEMGQTVEGSKVRILDPTPLLSQPSQAEEKWIQVRFSRDGIGWVKASSLLTL